MASSTRCRVPRRPVNHPSPHPGASSRAGRDHQRRPDGTRRTKGVRRLFVLPEATNTSPETRANADAGLGSETYAPPDNGCGQGLPRHAGPVRCVRTAREASERPITGSLLDSRAGALEMPAQLQPNRIVLSPKIAPETNTSVAL